MVDLAVPDTFAPAITFAWFAQWQGAALEDRLTLHVSDRFELRTSAIVLLAAAVSARAMQGAKTKIVGPNDGDSVFRMFIESLDSISRGEAANESAQPTNADLPRLIKSLATKAHAREKAEVLTRALQSEMPMLSAEISSQIEFFLEELGVNVVQHSGHPETGFGFGHIRVRPNRFEFAFADRGVGFFASLGHSFEFAGRIADDAEALKLALHPRVTSRPTSRSNMGHGLPALVEFSDSLGGDLWIASGSAMLHRRTIGVQRSNSIRSIPAWQGAWICLNAPIV